MWYEEHRPTDIEDYVWTNDATRNKIEEWIADPLKHPHLFLVGPTGTGKTTLAMIIRRLLDLDDSDVKFIPASLQSGVDTIREDIVGFCEVGGFGGLKLIILDEADRLSLDAQEVFRNVLDRYSDDVRFIFTGNRADRIIAPVQGRMWVVPVDQLEEDAFLLRVAEIAMEHGVDIDDETNSTRLMAIVHQNYPNMRLAISALQWATKDGVIQVPEAQVGPEWEDQMVALFDDFSVDAARTLVSTLRTDEYDLAYRMLYGRSQQVFGKHEGDAIQLIAEHIFRGALAGLPDITLMSCLILLGELKNGE